MRHKGPMITLAAGLVLAAILMVLNLSVTRQRDSLAGQGAGVGNETTPTAAAPSAAPSATSPAVTSPAATAQVTYAGNVTGGGATIAIAVKDGKAVAYLCDGRRVEAWLRGSARNGELALSGANNASLTGVFGNGVANGDIIAAGRRWSFSVKTVKPPSGLYRATANVRGALVVGGWIVRDTGEQTGVVVWDGVAQPAPPIDPVTGEVTVDGTRLDANPVDGTGL